ncbi:MAG TPA: J domain-containing protein [Bacteroidia bacterium]
MYVFFEHHKDSEGQVLATDVLCSSYEHGNGINWRIDKLHMELMTRLFKTPPVEARNYNDKTHVWSYLGDAGMHLMETIQKFFNELHISIGFYEIEDLESSIGQISLHKAKKIDPSQFFYNRAVPTTQDITKEFAERKLKEIGVIDKKSYRQAALRLHPDRNGGDGKAMSELNMYWGVFSA